MDKETSELLELMGFYQETDKAFREEGYEVLAFKGKTRKETYDGEMPGKTHRAQAYFMIAVKPEQYFSFLLEAREARKEFRRFDKPVYSCETKLKHKEFEVGKSRHIFELTFIWAPSQAKHFVKPMFEGSCNPPNETNCLLFGECNERFLFEV